MCPQVFDIHESSGVSSQRNARNRFTNLRIYDFTKLRTQRNDVIVG